MKIILTSIIAIFLLAGCVSKEIKPYEIYTVYDNSTIKQPLHVKAVLKVAKIKSTDQMNSDRIWYKKSSIKIDSYYYSKWNSSFTQMLEQNLVNNISKSNLFEGVYAKYSKVRTDLVLESELVEAVHDIGSNSVIFGIRLYLVKDKNLVSEHEFSYKEKCDSLDAKGAVKAYEKIIEKLNKDVVLWIKKSVIEN